MNRRGFLSAILAAGAAPAIVKAANIMPIFVRRESGLIAPDWELRIWQSADIVNDALLSRIDILYGWAAIRHECAVRISA